MTRFEWWLTLYLRLIATWRLLMDVAVPLVAIAALAGAALVGSWILWGLLNF